MRHETAIVNYTAAAAAGSADVVGTGGVGFGLGAAAAAGFVVVVGRVCRFLVLFCHPKPGATRHGQVIVLYPASSDDFPHGLAELYNVRCRILRACRCGRNWFCQELQDFRTTRPKLRTWHPKPMSDFRNTNSLRALPARLAAESGRDVNNDAALPLLKYSRVHRTTLTWLQLNAWKVEALTSEPCPESSRKEHESHARSQHIIACLNIFKGTGTTSEVQP